MRYDTAKDKSVCLSSLVMTQFGSYALFCTSYCQFLQQKKEAIDQSDFFVFSSVCFEFLPLKSLIYFVLHFLIVVRDEQNVFFLVG